MWISFLMWIIAGLSFLMLGVSKSVTFQISKLHKLFLVSLGIFICLLSFEKIFEFHLMIEFRAINFLGLFSERLREDRPYYWLYLLVISILLLIVINLFVVYYKLLKGMASKDKLKKIATYLFFLALLSVPLTILFDIIQGYLWYGGMKNTVFNSIESCWEVVGLTCFIGCNKYIAEFYKV